LLGQEKLRFRQKKLAWMDITQVKENRKETEIGFF
jgi:hypothetical protein